MNNQKLFKAQTIDFGSNLELPSLQPWTEVNITICIPFESKRSFSKRRKCSSLKRRGRGDFIQSGLKPSEEKIQYPQCRCRCGWQHSYAVDPKLK